MKLKPDNLATLKEWAQTAHKPQTATHIRPLLIIGGPGVGKTILIRALAHWLNLGGTLPRFDQIEMKPIMSVAKKGLPVVIDGIKHLSQEQREFLTMLGFKGQNLVVRGKYGMDEETRLPHPVPVIMTASTNYFKSVDDVKPYIITLPHVPRGEKLEDQAALKEVTQQIGDLFK